MAKDILATFGVDVDAVSGWLGSYGGADSPSDIQRGIWAGEIGTPRLLKLFEKYNLRTSWFVPRRFRARCVKWPTQVTRSVRTATHMRTRSR